MFSTSLSLTLALAAASFDEPPSIEYPGSRSSSHWVTTPRGARVAVSEGVEWKGVTVYLSLTWNLVAVDSETRQALWARNVSAFWNKVGFAEIEVEPGRKAWCVELAPASRTRQGADERQYHLLRTGEEQTPVGARKPEPGSPVEVQHWTMPECAIAESARFFVSTPEHWKQVRERLKLASEPEGFADVDFDERVLLVCCLGKVGNCRGVSPSGVRRIDDTLRIRLHHHTFQTMGGDATRHQPVGVISIPRDQAGGRIVLERNAQGLIGGPALWKELQSWEQRPAPEKELEPMPRRRRDV